MDAGARFEIVENKFAEPEVDSSQVSAPLTLFSWGYSGWGNSLSQLFQATEAVERSRGYDAPVFVDVRFSRSVRAEGFRDHALEKALPEGRYIWMKGLGNEAIGTGGLKIHVPETAEELLDIAVAERERRRRIVFFCSCESPAHCHRNLVRELLLKAAACRSVHVTVAEWPGGEPVPSHAVRLKVDPALFSKILGGARRIPIEAKLAIGAGAALPHGSYLGLTDGVRFTTVSVGPSRFSAGKWFLPVFVLPVEESHTIETLSNAVRTVRTKDNYQSFEP